MDPRQLKLFKEITLDYFSKLAPEDDPELEEPYLQFGDPELLDFTSLVAIHGEYDGCLYLSSPANALEQLLKIHGEGELSDRTRLDMCRELSNVLAGNASKAFAGNWEISVPRTLVSGDLDGLEFPESTFVMPIRWRGTRSLLVVGLTASPNGAAPSTQI